MKVTAKGEITIPQNIRDALGITSGTEVDFREEGGRFYIVKTSKPGSTGKFKKLRDIATTKMSTDEIMSLTRA